MPEEILSKGLFSRHRKSGPPRRDLAAQVIENVDLEVKSLASIKNQPGNHAVTELLRPIHPACPICITNPHAIIHSSYLNLGSHNCFHVPAPNNGNSFYNHLMPQLIHFLKLPNLSSAKNHHITPSDIHQAEKKQRLISCSAAGDREDELLKMEYLVEFVKSFAPSTLPFLWFDNFCMKLKGWLLGICWNQMFDGVCVHIGQIEMIKIALESGLPLVFVPVQRSHLDPFLISWVLQSSGFSALNFLAPKTLIQLPIIGRIAKCYGGLGFRYNRNTCSKGLGYNDYSINKALFIYMCLLWEKGQSLILPVQSHRSRNGKPVTLLLAREFISSLMNLYESHKVEDAFIIPVSVNYDILPEEDILEEWDIPQKPISKWYNWIYRFFSKKSHGFARISFSQPYRLREFKFQCSNEMNIELKSCSLFPIPGTDFQWDEDKGSLPSLSSVYGEVDFFMSNDEQQEVFKANALLSHTLYDAAKSTVIMSTQLISFILLKKYPFGIHLDNLIHETKFWANEIRSIRKHDLGFSGEMKDVVENAISLLGSCIQKTVETDKIFLKVNQDKSKLIKLDYYANHVTPLFSMHGIVCGALFKLLNPEFLANEGRCFRIPYFFFQESDLVTKSLEMAELLKGEFILHSPCISTMQAIKDTIEEMKNYGYFHFDIISRNQTRAHLEIDEDSDYDSEGFQVTSRHSFRIYADNHPILIERMKFYRSLVVPYFQIYGIGAQSLKQLIPSMENVKDFKGVEDMCLRLQIYKDLLLKVDSGIIRNVELVTMHTVRNFLNRMYNMGYICFYANADTEWRKFFYLSSEYEKSEALDAFSTKCFRFCTW